MKKLLALFLLSATPVFAQSVQQSGNVTPGHPVVWITNGVVGDGGTAVNSFLTSLGVMASGPGICQQSGPITGPYQQICLGVTATGGQITFGAFGGATPGNLVATINGNNYTFPFTAPATAVQGPISTTVGNIATWNNSGGTLLADSGVTPTTIPYTAPGTGAATITVQNHLAKQLSVVDFGAKCDGVTNDVTAIQNAITSGVSNGLPVRINGSCVIGSALSITSSVDFGGYNVQNDRLLTSTTGFNAINITGVGPVNLHDFTIVGSGANEGIDVGTAGVQNVNSRIVNLDITNFAVGIHLVSAGGINLSATRIESLPASAIPLEVENQFSPDGGDNELWGNTFVCGSSGSAGVVWKSGGGFYFFGNKILGSCTSNILLNMTNGVATSDILLSNNSMEGSSSGAGIVLQRAGATGTLFSVTITGNEIVGGTAGISIPTDANGVWLHNLTITGNAISGTATSTGMIAIDSSQNIAIAYNSISGQTGTKGVVLGSAVTGGVVGPNICTIATAWSACVTSTNGGTSVTTFAPF